MHNFSFQMKTMECIDRVKRQLILRLLLVIIFPALFVEGEGKVIDAAIPKEHQRGPTFRTEPPSRVEFSNSSGYELRCSADGSPAPSLTWLARDGSIVSDISGLRYTRDDGTLVFLPFPRTNYRQDVHDAVYFCAAANSVGAIISREAHVKSVVKQNFNPQVYDDFVVRGNTAVLRCHLPSFVRDHVIVDSWIRSDETIFKIGDNKVRSYDVLLSGELLIHDVQEKNSAWTYRCQARHLLTGEMVTSVSAGKIILTESHVSTLPRVTFSQSQIRVEEGSATQLPCVAQGNPPPVYRWMKDINGVLQPLQDDGRVWVMRGILNIRRVAFTDAGKYQCIMRNSIGERRIESNIIVIAPLIVSLRPQHHVLNIGQEATFNCNVSGYPIHTVSWKKDQRHIVTNSRVQLLSRDVLHIISIRREDRGMYQCFAYNEQDSAQGTAELKISDVPPSLISAFPELSIRQGERASLQCLSTGNPLPKITWMLDGEAIGFTRSTLPRVVTGDYVALHGHVISYLNISEVLLEDSGEYRCQVSNEVGSTFHTARLNVYGPPFVRRMKNITAISGNSLEIQCPYGGYPVKNIRWFKNGIILPLNHRQKVSQTGTLSVYPVQQVADEGEYSCSVRGADGQTASGSTYVNVAVAPVVDSRFLLESYTVDAGTRTKLMCVVMQGDPPLHFMWLKDGAPFLAHGHTTVQTFEDTSIITIKNISPSDRGHYTCIASNAASTTNATTSLIVNVPPQWSVEPNNATAVLGNTVRMDCAASGFPTPSILWKKLIYEESAAGDFTYVHSSPRAQRYNNGTLVLSDLEEDDAGAYLCQASNEIGAGLSKIIYLQVRIPPRFSEPYHSQIITEGSNATLQCLVKGDLPISVTWIKGKEPVDPKKTLRYYIRETSESQELLSRLHILKVSRNDSAPFICSAKNDIGEDEAIRQVVVQGRPDPPDNIAVSNITSRSVTLQWKISFNGNSPITGSVVQYKTNSGDEWSAHSSQILVSGSETTTTIRGLAPVTTYFLRVIAENAVGQSSPSYAINVTTEEEAPTTSPRDVQVHSTGAQSMKVSWKPPLKEEQNGYIRGYYVGYRISGSSEPYYFKQVKKDQGVETDNSLSLFTYITGLRPFTQYDIVVKAFNGAGSGPKSIKIVGKTLETAPPTSPIVKIKATTTSSIDISWQKDTKDKSAITEYTLHYKKEDGSWIQEKLSSSQDHFSLHGLQCGMLYHLYMTASNSLGSGEPSLPVSVRTMGSAPIPPEAAVFLSVNMTTTELNLNTWNSGGCPILYFVIQHRLKYQTHWAFTSEKLNMPRDSYTLRHLSPDREYVVLVTAQSEAGAVQAEYVFRTQPAKRVADTSSPTSGKWEIEIPFYKNLALVIPVIVSSLVLTIVIFAVVVCLRKHSQDRRDRIENESRKSGESLMMNDINKKNCNNFVSKTSHYACPSGAKSEYSEPYTCSNSTKQDSDGLFATIKRCPTRPVYVAASHKPSSESRQEMTPHDGLLENIDKWHRNSQKSLR